MLILGPLWCHPRCAKAPVERCDSPPRLSWLRAPQHGHLSTRLGGTGGPSYGHGYGDRSPARLAFPLPRTTPMQRNSQPSGVVQSGALMTWLGWQFTSRFMGHGKLINRRAQRKARHFLYLTCCVSRMVDSIRNQSSSAIYCLLWLTIHERLMNQVCIIDDG